MSKKLYDIVSKVFNVNLDRINDDSSPENLEEWDSFNFYVLLDEIENEFNVKFDLDETLEIKKIGDIKKLFVKYGIRCEQMKLHHVGIVVKNIQESLGELTKFSSFKV